MSLPVIKEVNASDLSQCLEVIHKSFETVANEFNLSCENCPKHTSFMPLESLQTQMSLKWIMYGLFEAHTIIGYFSLSKLDETTYELNNVAIHPNYRHKGYGKMILDCAKEKVCNQGGTKIVIGIIDESTVLKDWYKKNGFVHTGTSHFNHLPFTVGFMEWTHKK